MHQQHPKPLWRYLWLWSLAALALSWLTLVMVARFTGVHEADEITDGQLASSVALLLRQPALNAKAPITPESNQSPAASPDNYAPELHVLVWHDGQLVWDTHALAPALPADLRPQHQDLTLQVNGRSVVWRALLGQRELPGGHQRRVLVLIDKDRRDALGRDFAEHLVQPALILLPLVALLLLWATRRGIRPLEQLSQQVTDLDLDTGKTLADEQPFVELAGSVRAINSLVQRLQSQVLRERSFASDVAHELRTPLTAQVLQARLARGTEDVEQRNAALQQIEQDALRAGRILTQLTELTRAQGLDAGAMQAVNLNALAHQSVSEHVMLAHQRGQDLALELPARPLWVRGHPTMLELALRNLIDNALRHTPAGTQVEVRVQAWSDGQVCLSVNDDGAPGAAQTRALTGMGIGLTLVRRIAHWHGIAFEHQTGEPPWRTRYLLRWPAVTAAPDATII